MIKVLFFCLGNICRSPMAEGIFIKKIHDLELQDKFIVDSAGTGDWHVGELPDERTQTVAENHGISLTNTARQLRKDDLQNFDYIIGMDEKNIANAIEIFDIDGNNENLLLMNYFHSSKPNNSVVEDPYWGDLGDFERMYDELDTAVAGLLQHLIKKHKLN